METKTCALCKLDLPAESFALSKGAKDGRQSYCRICNAQYQRKRTTTAEREPRSREKAAGLTTAELTDLAYATRNWALKRGASIDPVTKLYGYFLVDEWHESFNQSPKVWRAVKMRMLRLGIPLAGDDGHGFYIGNKGDEAKMIASGVKQSITRMRTLGEQIAAAQDSGHWSDIQPRLSRAIAQTSIGGMGKLPSMFEACGADLPRNFGERLLLVGGSS